MTEKPRPKSPTKWRPHWTMLGLIALCLLAWMGIDWACHHPMAFVIGWGAYCVIGGIFAFALTAHRNHEIDRLEMNGEIAAAEVLKATGWLWDFATWPRSVVALVGNAVRMTGGR